MKIINVTVLLFKNCGQHLYIGGHIADMKLGERGGIHQDELGEEEGQHF